MKNTLKYSDCDSSQEEDQVNVNYFQRLRSMKVCKSANNSKQKNRIKRQDDVNQPQEQQQFQLKPKIYTEPSNNKIIPNNSNVSQTSNYVNKRPLTAAYTFKLKTPTNKKKKNDPVALFQQTTQMWKKDKFLTSRGNNKEGRKLDLDKRNKQLNKF